MTERADQTMRLPILQLSCRLFLGGGGSITSSRSVSPPTAQIWLPATFGFPKDRYRRFVNATVTQYTSSINGVSLPTDEPHGRVTVHGCTVRSPLTGCQVKSRPRDRFSRYSEWTDTFRTALEYVRIMFRTKAVEQREAHFILLRNFRLV